MTIKTKNLKCTGVAETNQTLLLFVLIPPVRKISRALSLHFNATDRLTDCWEWFTSTLTSAYHSLFTPKGQLHC
jgi:hypothetical protein